LRQEKEKNILVEVSPEIDFSGRIGIGEGIKGRKGKVHTFSSKFHNIRKNLTYTENMQLNTNK